ncbi:hypothetical protein EIN_004450 [Entamoeba invadens IP1]|uniref:CRESS-DNA virus Rep endonuclease domain-containing protein n=1 Tax=Entamoeba invadens IP1 TaxID=370355 RepID=L7FKJ3_ENTIV|nr:hypothetical protein EIN_004450 [Entamoeba invadens IP1]ELP86388.1 hypothetical protein EIN_004450 [Entamoeba invadens IP1]|eukprot:XP_004185734.1 hypothetical protein EIN_004450 [Entamoeba invadens IP1]
MSKQLKGVKKGCKPAGAAAQKPTEAVVKPFRLNAKNLLLTWPQTPLPKENAMKQLRTLLDDYGIIYIVVCQEKHEKEGLHLHAVVMLERKVCFRDQSCLNLSSDWISKDIHGNYLSAKSPKDAVAYVKKETTEELISGEKLTIYQALQALKVKGLMKGPKRMNLKVHWFYGKPGCGKSFTARKEAEDKWGNDWARVKFTLNTGFCIGYGCEKGVVIDDLRARSICFEELLDLLDVYETSVNVKGGSLPWCAEEIWVTCPADPEALFVNHTTGEKWDGIEQLLRRITDTREFTEKYTKPTEEVVKKPSEAEATQTWDEEGLSPRRRKMEISELTDDAESWIAGRIAMAIEDGEIPPYDPEEEEKEKLEKKAEAAAKVFLPFTPSFITLFCETKERRPPGLRESNLVSRCDYTRYPKVDYPTTLYTRGVDHFGIFFAPLRQGITPETPRDIWKATLKK